MSCSIGLLTAACGDADAGTTADSIDASTGSSGSASATDDPTSAGPSGPTTETTAGTASTGSSESTSLPTGTSASSDSSPDTDSDSDTGVIPPSPACDPAQGGGSPDVATPQLALTLADRWEEGWLGSPSVGDLDGDGAQEIIVPRGRAIVVWGQDGQLVWKYEAQGGRVWASAVVADLVAQSPGLEVAFASRERVYLLSADGVDMPGFPVTWEDEIRSFAAGDVDGDGDLDLVAGLAMGGPTDVMNAWSTDGQTLPGFPPLQSGASGCDDKCYLAGLFDQNIAVGDLDGDGVHDIVAPHDNAYASIHKGTGEAFDADPGFSASKTPGVRYLHDLAEAQMGWAPDEDTALQAHFTNTAPAIADIDGDGSYEVVMLGSVQNAAQTNREQGVALWVVRHDVTRLAGWDPPVHAPDYLSGLWDYGDNIVAITNQVSVADLDADAPGLEAVFAGFDGRVHAVSSDGQALWSTVYTSDDDVMTGGVVIGDLSGDGAPEIVFATYSTAQDKSALWILNAAGAVLHELPLPRRGAMPVPTLADVDDDGAVEILVSLKDAEDMVESVRVYTVPGSSTNCLPWPTGRANALRNGWVP